jgi:hypothetical protein
VEEVSVLLHSVDLSPNLPFAIRPLVSASNCEASSRKETSGVSSTFEEWTAFLRRFEFVDKKV